MLNCSTGSKESEINVIPFTQRNAPEYSNRASRALRQAQRDTSALILMPHTYATKNKATVNTDDH